MVQSAINRLEIIIILKIYGPFYRWRRGEPEATSRLPLSCAAGSCRLSSAVLRQIGPVFTPLWPRQLRPQERCRHLTKKQTNQPKQNRAKIRP